MDYPVILRQIRKVNQWTQTDLAKALDVTRSYASQLETGAREPSAKVIDKIKVLESKSKLHEVEAEPYVKAAPPGEFPLSEEVAVLRALVVSQQRTIEAQADTIRDMFKGRGSAACGI